MNTHQPYKRFPHPTAELSDAENKNEIPYEKIALVRFSRQTNVKDGKQRKISILK